MAALAAAAALAGPTVLAFYSGGFFDEPRLWAGLVLWACWPRPPWPGPLPRARRAAGRALGGLAGLAAWTAASVAWAPLGRAGARTRQRVTVYLAALCAAAAWLRPGAAARRPSRRWPWASPWWGYGALRADAAGRARDFARASAPAAAWSSR